MSLTEDEYSADDTDGGEEYSADKDDFEEVNDGTTQPPGYETTKNRVLEAEKNVSLALEVSKQHGELTVLKREAATFRATLLQGINGGVTDSNNYEHVSLEELLRIRLQEATASSAATNDELSASLKDDSSVSVIQKLEHKLALEKQHSDELEAKCITLKDELAASTKQHEGLENLHVKISEMNGRLRHEREQKSKVQKELAAETKKVEALSDHIEKLMIHLKHEAISKARSLSDQSRLQRELESMKSQIEHMGKKNDRKDKLIAELRGTGRLLEDQLRLMDEKYMEIRSKLDWTRTQTTKIVRQKETELEHLREKFSVVDTTPRNDGDSKKVAVKPKAYKPKSIFYTEDKRYSIDSIAAKSQNGIA